MGKKSSLFKAVAAATAALAVTLSIAGGATLVHTLRKDKENGSSNQQNVNPDDNVVRSIDSITLTNTYGLVDEYTIYYTDGTTSTFIVVNGAQGEQGIQGLQGLPGTSGHTPTIEIGMNGHWIIDGNDTGVVAEGPQGPIGPAGENGITPHIGDNGNWFIGEQDTGVLAEGKNGKTPLIGANGNWWIGGTDTGVPANGTPGPAGKGIDSINKTSSDGLVDTYTITYTDGTTSLFYVTNGADGQAAAQGEPGEDGHTPVITINDQGYWVVDGVATTTYAQGPQGPAGQNGKSAYEIAVEHGYTGTEIEWLASLIGEAGAAGANGNDGKSAYELAVEHGYTGTEQEWLLTLVGAQGAAGQNGADGKSAYELAVEAGYTGSLAEWLVSLVGLEGAAGQNGQDGKSAYDLAVEAGYTGTKEQWLASLAGEAGAAGANGQDGKSAYEIAVDHGYTGTEQEWLDSLVGAAGSNGTNGKSAYEIAVENGYTGTVTEWLLTLKGEKGDDGRSVVSIVKTDTQGLVDTYTITYSDNTTSVFYVTNGADGSQGIQGVAGNDGHTPVITINDQGYWVVDGNATTQLAQGPQGEQGRSVVSIIKTSTEGLVDTYTITYSDNTYSTFTVTNGSDGSNGSNGTNGTNGSSLLTGNGEPSASQGSVGDSYVDVSTWVYYVKTSEGWQNKGSFKGTDGAAGSNGTNGTDGNDGISITNISYTSSAGLVDTYTITFSDNTTTTFTVTNGAAGTNGTNGNTVITGSVDPTSQGTNGDSYINTTSWEYFVKENDAWVSQGHINGADGLNGTDGTSFRTGSGVPASSLGIDGDSYLDISTWNIYTKADGAWTVQGNIHNELSTYTVSFDVTGSTDSAPDSQTVTEGHKATDPFEQPHKQDYYFQGWYTDEGNKWNFEKDVVTGDITLHAVWAQFKVNEDGVLTACSATGDVVIPSYFDGKVLTEISQGVFIQRDDITSVTIPSSVTKIGSYAFYESSIENVYLSEGLRIIGTSAFEDSKLKSIVIPNSVVTIEEHAFDNATELRYVAFSNSYTRSASNLSVGNEAFKNCTALLSVSLPARTSSIGSNVFTGCNNLEALEAPFFAGHDNEEQYLGYFFGATSASQNSAKVPTSLKSVTYNSDAAITVGAFKDCANIENIAITGRPTSIALGALEGCYGIKTLTLPYTGGSPDGVNVQHFGYIFGFDDLSDQMNMNADYSIETVTLTGGNGVHRDTISQSAFMDLQIDKIVLPEGITTIEESAFGSCTADVNVPRSVASFGYNAFADSGITSIVISKDVVIIPDGCFSGSALEQVTFEKRTAQLEIGDEAFYQCTSLQSIYIPNKVTQIGTEAFRYCSQLAYVTFENNAIISNIGTRAFCDCISLKSISTPTHLSTLEIGEYAFAGCTSLESAAINDDDVILYTGIFEDCSSLKTITVPFIGGTATENRYFSYIFGDEVYSYSNLPDEVPASLETIVIKGGTDVPENAFRGLSNVKSIVLPDSVLTLGNAAFRDCSSLVYMAVPSQVTTISKECFYNCKSLKTVTMSNDVETFDDYAFYHCESMQTISKPNGLRYINQYAFGYCKSLLEFSLYNIKSIGWNGFVQCESLQEVSLPSSLTYDDGEGMKTHLAYGAFERCYGLKYAYLPNNILSISQNCFRKCTSLGYISIPASVTEIDGAAFDECTSLAHVEILNGDGSTPLTLGNVSAGRGEIFRRCYSLTTIYIPSRVTYFGYHTFEYCYNLETVIIEGNSSLSFGGAIFQTCTGLKKLVIFAAGSSYGSNMLNECTSLETLVLPFAGEEPTSTYGKKLCNYFNAYGSSEVPSSLKSVTILGGNCIYKDYFINCKYIETIILGEGIQTIGESAFENCTSLKSLVIPSSVTSIGLGALRTPQKWEKMGNIAAFSGGAYSYGAGAPNNADGNDNDCYFDTDTSTLYTKISGAWDDNGGPMNPDECGYGVPDSSIASSGYFDIYTADFYNKSGFDSSLESLTVPFIGGSATADNVQFLSYIFGATDYNDSSNYVPTTLKKITVTGLNGADTMTIPDGAFYELMYVEEFVLPEYISTVGKYAFYHCDGLKSMTFHDPVVIKDDAFSCCESLQTVYMGNGGTIGYCSFQSCSSLTYIYLRDVTSIGNSAFSGCSSLLSISIPETVTSLGEQCFVYCSDLQVVEFVEWNDSARPDETQPTINIQYETFFYCYKLQQILFNNVSINRIDSEAFRECTALKEITIPDCVTSISSQAFLNCTALKEFVVSSKNTAVAGYALAGCSSIEKIVVPTAAPTGAVSYKYFGYYFGITQYQNHETQIPASLKTVVLTGAEDIPGYAFYGCVNIETIVLEADESASADFDIYPYAFANCYSAKTIKLPYLASMGGIETIMKNAFSHCYSLESINLHDSLTLIGENAFESCISLDNVVIPDNVEIIWDNAFKGCIGLTNVTLGAGVETLEKGCFSGCISLKSIVLPDTVTSIQDSAFSGCRSLTTIRLSKNITNVGTNVFSGCDSLAIIIAVGFNDTSDYDTWAINMGFDNVIDRSHVTVVIKQ